MKNILFDLDGTLTDPKEGIFNGIQYALDKLKREIPDESVLLDFIGPPLLDSFDELFGGAHAKEAQRAVYLYREYYKVTGQFENRVYSGIHELLKALGEKNMTLFIASSKPHYFVRQIADYFKLTSFFKNIYGSELSGERGEKEELIKYLMDNEKLNPSETIMVGDRKYDVIGAHKNGIKCIGAGYGYGVGGELEDAGADEIVSSPSEMLSLLQSF